MTAPRVVGPARLRRAGSLVTALLTLAALESWLTPFVTPGGQGYPFGCGSLAHPNGSALARQVCEVATQARDVRTLALLLAAAAVAVVTATFPARRPSWAVGALAAIPVLAVGLLLLLSPLQVNGADGGTVSCGRPVAPARDSFAGGLCSDVPGARLGEGIALVGAAALLAVGLPWIMWRGPGMFPRPGRRPGGDPAATVIDLRDDARPGAAPAPGAPAPGAPAPGAAPADAPGSPPGAGGSSSGRPVTAGSRSAGPVGAGTAEIPLPAAVREPDVP
ncbi:MAG TPA: hypothetical protein VI248_19855 [Kineosporiaceae bacterium]